MGEPSYKIYDASAGSGKTYTLVRAYLSRILKAPNQRAFKNILAITFTNKAVNELKTRILLRLFDFTQNPVPDRAISLFKELQQDLELDQDALRSRSAGALKEILHNYAFFDISTIDKFTHRVIRTFARDLNLSYNFNVLLETDILLEEAVAQLVSKAGEENDISRALIDFAIEKADEEKSWDISLDLKKIGKLIFEESHYHHLEALKTKAISDFNALKKILKSNISQLEMQATALANKALTIIENSGLPEEAFPRATLINHFKRIKTHTFNISTHYNNKLAENLESGNILTKDYELPYPDFSRELWHIYRDLKPLIYNIQFLKNAYKNLLPLTLLHAIKKEADAILTEKNQLPIGRFNSLISEEIREQPTPFIYERLGEYYRHYIIDEFQDTSALQWENLIPLIGHPLSGESAGGEKGSLILVGDAKQAIYRWRGGKAEQFINLSLGSKSPFVIPPDVIPLERNFRSCENIINFNNEFFQHSAPFLSGSGYRHLFEQKHIQEYNDKKGGLVSFQILEEESTGEKADAHTSAVLEVIKNLILQGYPYRAICILVRKKKEGQAVAKVLAENQIPIISSETLLLNNNPSILFLINLLKYWLTPSDQEIQFQLLTFLAKGDADKHQFYQKYLGRINQLFEEEFSFNIQSLVKTSVYDGLEIAIKKFGLGDTPSAYLVHFMEEVFIVEQGEDTSVNSFITHWEEVKEKRSIKAPDNLNAVTIMTIHKAKGLEFPVVIFPFAVSELVQAKDKKMWLPVMPGEFGGFKYVMVDLKKEIEHYPSPFDALYKDEIEKIELDAFNLLYVALTRAVNALYIITEKGVNSNGSIKQSYSGIFYNYLQSKNTGANDQLVYEFGVLPEYPETQLSKEKEIPLRYGYSFKDRASFKPITQSGVLWDTERGLAIEKGNYIHHILGQIETVDDLPQVLEQLEVNGDCEPTEIAELADAVKNLVNHPELSTYFDSGSKVRNEWDIIGENGVILRPDRIWIQGSDCVIIDYKTGLRVAAHMEQINAYADALQKMGYRIIAKILVYIGSEIIIENIK